MAKGRSLSACGGLLLSLWLWPTQIAAQTHHYQAYLDTDLRATTGCVASGSGGERFEGADYRLSVMVAGSPPSVTASTLSLCEGGSFSTGNAVATDYRVGLNNGLPRPGGLSDVVEMSLARAALPGAEPQVRVGFVARSDSGSTDALLRANGGSGPPMTVGSAQLIPTLGFFGALLLVLGMSALALRALKQNRRLAQLLLVGAFLSAGLAAWAANFIADGQVGDWAGAAPNGMDALGDPVPMLSATDIVGAFAAEENHSLYFRIDVVDVENGPPVAVDDAWTTEEDLALSIAAPGVLGNDSDPDNNPISAQLVSGPIRGTVTLSPDGGFLYTPAVDAHGGDSFTYRAFDGQTTSLAAATVAITVASVNDAPIFTAGSSQTVLEDAGPQTVQPWAVGIDDGDPGEAQNLAFEVTANSNPALFSAGPAVSSNGALSYTPAANANGTATITLRLNDDGSGTPPSVNQSAPQTFTVTVIAVNDAPTLVAGVDQTLNEDAGAQTVVGWASAMDDGDPELSQALQFTTTVSDTTGNLAFSAAPAIDAAGTLSYAATANTNGVATIDVRLVDDGSNAPPNVNQSAIATFTITVSAINDAPVFAAGPNQSVLEDAGAQVLDPWATGIDDGDPEATQALQFIITDNSNAALFSAGPTVSPTGMLSYTTAANANGNATIALRIEDSGSNTPPSVNTSAAQSFTITVAAVNDAPSYAATNPPSLSEDAGAQSLPNWATFNPGPPDEAGQSVLGYQVSAIGNGALFSAQPAVANDGTLTYAVAANTSGSSTFTVRVQDTGGTAQGGVDLSAPQTFTITVDAVNDAPMNTLPGPQTTGDTTPLVLGPANATAISVVDIDAGTGIMRMSFGTGAPANGTLTLANPGAGLTTLTGNGTELVIATGTLAALNTALNGPAGSLTFTPAAGTSAARTITVISNDQGHTGSGGAQIDSDSITVNVDGPPVVSSTPVNGATIASDAAITVNFSESVNVIAGIALTCGESIALSGTTGAGVTSLNLGYADPLPAGSCTLTVPATSVADVDLIDPPDHPEATHTATFTVDAAPALTASSPAAAEVVSTAATISFSFNEAVNNLGGAITLDCGGAVAGAIGGSGTSTLTFVSASPLTPGASCSATAVALQIADVDVIDPPQNPLSNSTIAFSVDAAPAFVSATPAAAGVVGTGQTVSFTFSENVDNLGAAITLNCGGAVPGAISGDGTPTLTFTPTNPLIAGSGCTATAVAAQIGDSDAIDPPQNPSGDVTRSFMVDLAPTVISTSPAQGSVDVPLAGVVIFGFSESVDYTAGSFSYVCGGNPIAFGVSAGGGNQAVLSPVLSLPVNAPCTVTALTTITDTDSADPPNNLGAEFALDFRSINDNPPTVVQTTPVDGANVSDDSPMTVSFSEPVDASAGSVTLSCAGGQDLVTAGTTASAATQLTLDVAPMPFGDCVLTVHAQLIRDTDGLDPPDTMVGDHVVSFRRTGPPVFLSTALGHGPELAAYAYPVVLDTADSALPVALSVDRAPTGSSIMAASTTLQIAAAAMQPAGSLLSRNAMCRIALPMAVPGNFDMVERWKYSRRAVLSTPLVGRLLDRNGDGSIDQQDPPVVLVQAFNVQSGVESGAGKLQYLDGATGRLLAEIPGVTSRASTQPAYADLDGDGRPEIIFLDYQGGVTAVTESGTVRWRNTSTVPTLAGDIFSSGITIADLEADGTPEILANGSVINANGSTRWMTPQPVGRIQTPLHFVDELGVGRVVMGNQVLSTTGQLLWAVPQVAFTPPVYFTAVADLNVDGRPELLVSIKDPSRSSVARLELYSATGSMIWRREFSPPDGSPPTIADFTGDGRPDIAIAGMYHAWLIDGDGKEIWRVPVDNHYSDSIAMAAFDFNGDGRVEAVITDHVRMMIVDGPTGSVRDVRWHASGTANEYAVIADIDGDDHADLLVPTDSYGYFGVRAFSGASRPWARTRARWNQFNYTITDGDGPDFVPSDAGRYWQRNLLYRVNAVVDPEQVELLLGDLAVHDTRLLEAPSRIAFTVSNRGLAEVSGVEARIETFGASGSELLGTVAVASLLPGASRDLEFAADVSELDRDVRIQATRSTGADECDTANNTAIGMLVRLRAQAADGQFARQAWLLNVDNVNAAPIIPAQVPPVALTGASYGYRVVAQDPDLGDKLRFSVANGPPRLTIHPLSGELHWVPRIADIGTVSFNVTVTDLAGLSASRQLTLTVAANPENQPPVITSVPPVRIAYGEFPVYFLVAHDPEGEALSYALLEAPVGVHFDASIGRFYFAYPSQTASWFIRVRVRDARGAYTDQNFTLTMIGNNAPIINSTPGLAIRPSQLYSYIVRATDPDNDPIGYSLGRAPQGVSIDNHTGEIRWTPTVDQIGSHPFLVWAADPHGGYAEQFFNVTVSPPSLPPTITSQPVFAARVGLEYRYDVEASDPDSATLNYTLQQSPPGMTIDAASGLIRWTATAPGPTAVTVRVDDSESWVEQSWTINVVAADVELEAHIAVAPASVLPGNAVSVVISETGAAGAVVRSLTLDGAPIAVNPAGEATVSATAFGRHELIATVADPYDSDTAVGEFFVIDPSDTTPPVVDLIAPVDNAEITAPTPVRITVTDAGLRDWQLYFRESNTDGAATMLATGTAEAVDQVAASFDPTVLLNGQYTLFLVATDNGGNATTDSAVVRVTGDMKIGNFSLTFEEISIPVAGIPVTVSRTYDTRRRKEVLDFGHGWSVDYQNVRVHESRKLGFSWLIREIRNGTVTDFCNESNGDRVVTVTLPDGGVESFRAVAVPHCNPIIAEPNVHLAFEPIDGTDSTLEQTSYGLLRLATIVGFPGMMTLIDPSTAAAPVDPTTYTLTMPEGIKYELDQNFGIRRITDLNGNTLTYSDDGVVHSSGIGIDFERDAQGRISALVMPDASRIEYDYSAAGDLLAARDALDVATTFEYAYPAAPHYLTRITDGRNLPVARNEYDDDGRLIASIDANGHRIEFDHQIDARIERVRDRRGNFTTYIYDEQGRVLTEANALNQTITRSYDADGNVLSEADPLGRVRAMTYDQRGNMLTETNDLGHTTTSTFNSRNSLLTQVDELGRPAISNTYNSLSGALLTTRDALNQTTTFTYDSGVGGGSTETGELKSITDALGRQTLYGLDIAGRGWRIREVDAAGTITRYTHDSMGRVRSEFRPRTRPDGTTVEEQTTTTYDAKGRVTRVDHADGSFSTTEYNAIDKPVRECDALLRCIETTYTARGEVARITHADGSFEETSYDANGNTVAQRDRGGRTTRMVYDTANRLVETVYPDATPANGDDGNPANNPRTRNQYDAAGQLEFVFDERGNRTEYRYDDAGRQTHVIDALGNTTVTAYDAAGQRLSVTDAQGRVTRFAYDAAGRLVETIHPDLTAASDDDNPRTTVEFDAAGQKIAATDEMGRITRYAFDQLGRLERVVLPNPATGTNPPLVDGQSPAGSGTLTTRYVYDQRGNKTQQIDARGRVTRFEYDAMGRQTARELPLGQRETMSYNVIGEQIGKLTFNNQAIAMAYDNLGRPQSITLPDRTRTFSYTANNQVSQIVDGSDTWRFAYDARDRLVRAEDSFGRAIEYGYDAAGNRTELATCTVAGATCTSRQLVEYSFDELNRLREVVARLDGGVPQTTQYRYSPVGSRSGMTHPNGTVVDYTFDVRNRLKTLVHKAGSLASAATLLALTYSVDASGLRTQIAETRPGAGPTPTYTRVTDYEYDAVQRLTREQVSGNHGNPDRVHTWTYDAVGNRMTQVAVVGAPSGAITTTTSYAYDSNDRLLSEALAGAPSGAITTTRTYDAAGNLTETREGATTVAQYTWDAEGRLTGAVLGNGPTQKSTAYRYDPNGIRRSQQVTEAGGAVTRTEYLVDPNQAYAQVLEEWGASVAAGPLPEETLATTYVYGDDLISQTKLALGGPSVTSVYHYDGLGTTRALSAYKVDAGGVPQAGHGEITDRYAYTAFGESDPAGTSGDTSGSSDNNYRYTGEQLDPNLGFYYLRARYMDPGQGRFLGMDPWSGEESVSTSLHKYLYADANPISGTDPTGMFTLLDASVAQDIQAIVSNIGRVGMRQVGRRLVTQAQVLSRGILSAIRKCFQRPSRCDSPVNVLVTGLPIPNTAEHIDLAQGAGKADEGEFKGNASLILRRTKPHSRKWLKRTDECGSGKSGILTGKDCDEYPFASTLEGGRTNYYKGKVSLKPVISIESPLQGGLMSTFYRRCNIPRTFTSSTPWIVDKSAFVALGVPALPSFFVCKRA